MTHGGLRISAIALGAAAFVSLSPLSAASAATVVHHPAHGVHHAAGGVHRQVAHVHGRVYAHHYGHVYAHHYRHAHRYAYGYGYNPGAAGVIGGGYPYCDDYSYGPYYYGSCDTTVTDTRIRITTMATGLVVRSSSEGAASTTALTTASTTASLSTGAGLGSPPETSATRAASVAARWAASVAARWAASVAATWAALPEGLR